MNWYIAKVIFKISNARNKDTSQFDEHLRLIEADSFEEAFFKARILGIKEEDHLMDDDLQSVSWEFVNVSEIIPLRELKDGLELYSQIHETAEVRAYINLVHMKAASLQLNPQTAA